MKATQRVQEAEAIGQTASSRSRKQRLSVLINCISFPLKWPPPSLDVGRAIYLPFTFVSFGFYSFFSDLMKQKGDMELSTYNLCALSEDDRYCACEITECDNYY